MSSMFQGRISRCGYIYNVKIGTGFIRIGIMEKHIHFYIVTNYNRILGVCKFWSLCSTHFIFPNCTLDPAHKKYNKCAMLYQLKISDKSNLFINTVIGTSSNGCLKDGYGGMNSTHCFLLPHSSSVLLLKD